MESYEEQGGESSVMDDQPLLDPYLQSVWGIFLRLNRKRQRGLAAQPLEYGHMESFFRLMKKNPSSNFIFLIDALDNAWLDWHTPKDSS